MGLFKKKVIDERVTQLQNRVYRELCVLIITLCSVSLVYKTMAFEPDFKNIILELLVILIGGAYYLFRSAMLGIYTDEVEMHDRSNKWPLSKKKLVMGLLIGVGISLLFAIVNSLRFGETSEETITFFFLILLTSLIIYIPGLVGMFVLPYALAKYKSDKRNRDLDEMDDEDER